MKLEDHVTSLKMSKKLKELGIEKDSIFWWVNTVGYDNEHTDWVLEFNEYRKPDRCCNDAEDSYSAFLATELWEMLPKAFKSPRSNNLLVSPYLEPNIHSSKHGILIYRDAMDALFESRPDQSIPDSLAEALIWCVENKYLDINKKD